MEISDEAREAAEAMRDTLKVMACSDPEKATKIVMLSIADLDRVSVQAFQTAITAGHARGRAEMAREAENAVHSALIAFAGIQHPKPDAMYSAAVLAVRNLIKLENNNVG